MRIKLQRLRETAGFTQATMAEAVGISRSHYSQIETGAKAPALMSGLKSKRILGYVGDDIFFDEMPRLASLRKLNDPKRG